MNLQRLLWCGLIILSHFLIGADALFGRRRQTGSRRRQGARPKTNMTFGIPTIAFYCILGGGGLFIICLVAALVYYCCVVRKRDRERVAKVKYAPVDFRSKAQKTKEMELYLASTAPAPASPGYNNDRYAHGSAPEA